MIEWKLQITYQLKPYELQAVVEYESAQILRIRVQGKKSTILLENNYPMLRAANSKKGMKWTIREGSLGPGTRANSFLLLDIMKQLEYNIKDLFDERDRDRLTWK